MNAFCWGLVVEDIWLITITSVTVVKPGMLVVYIYDTPQVKIIH